MIKLRGLESGDQGLLLEWRNSPEVATYMYSNHLITPEEHEEWFSKARDDSEQHRHRMILVDGRPVGLQSLHPIDVRRGTTTWGFYIAETSARRRGVGSWMGVEAITTCFSSFGLRKINSEVLAENKAALAMHESLGFRREAYFRKHAMKDGMPVDVVGCALLSEEWEMVGTWVRAKLHQRGLIE
jgi:UDP-4-amino-4,6-dideoxy-N-acetyl-beta-L-altrosamine N-acetyltransferase